METFVISTEADIRKWVKKAVKETLESTKLKEVLVTNVQEPLLDTKTIVGKLGISLVRLRQWRKHGLPSHKQNRRVYFLYSEVMGYIARQKPKKKYEWI